MTPEEATGCILRGYTSKGEELVIYIRESVTDHKWERIFEKGLSSGRIITVIHQGRVETALIHLRYEACTANGHNPTITWTTAREAKEAVAEELL